MRAKVIMGVLIGIAGLAATGCAEKFTFDRWQTVHDGMTGDVVEATLGKPFTMTEQVWVYSDQDMSATVMVYFDKGKVVGTTWQDPKHGMLGKSPYVNQPGESEQINVQKTK